MGSTIIEQDFPYDIVRRGSRDASRHNRRVNDATRKQLKDIISQQDIITSAGNKKVKVRLKYLDQYRFIFHRDRQDHLGRDQFDELEEGEIIYKPTGDGASSKPGDDVGDQIFEAEFTVDELTEMMIEHLKLPDLDETKKTEIISEILEYTDRRKQSGACLDKKQTLLANIKRKSKEGHEPEEIIPIINDDLRFRTWNIAREKHSNAVIFLMMDKSGSMEEDKIYAVKALYFWIVQFLRRRYDKVEIKFISHDWIARELNEHDFFSISESGGTKVSSAYELCRDIIHHNYPADSWNIYCFHASDGDSWGDEDYCMKLVHEILDTGSTLFAYAEIDLEGRDESALYKQFLSHMQERDGILTAKINKTSDILDALHAFLRNSVRSQKH